MPVLDKNRKELGVGDEVVLHFRVTAVWPQPEGSADLVNLESAHNRHGKTPVSDTDLNFQDYNPISLTSTPSFRTILQRKAPKPAETKTPEPAAEYPPA